MGIHPRCYEATGLQWQIDGRPQTLVDVRLPFGASASVGIFHRLSQAVRRGMCRAGFTNCVAYLDDFVVACPTEAECRAAFSFLFSLLRELGFAINYSKLVAPTTCLTFLGIQVDSKTGVISLPEEKLQAFRRDLDHAASQTRIRRSILSSIIGRLSWLCVVARAGRCFLRPLIEICNNLKHPRHRVAVRGALQEWLWWWQSTAVLVNHRYLWYPIHKQAALELDACAAGGAAVVHLPGQAKARAWYWNWQADLDGSLQHLHINDKEALAALLGLEQLLTHPMISGARITVYCDSSAAVGMLNRAVSRNSLVMQQMRVVVAQCIRLDVVFQAFHVSGAFNTTADALSRLHDPGEFGNAAARMNLPLHQLPQVATSSVTFRHLLLQAESLTRKHPTTEADYTSSCSMPSRTTPGTAMPVTCDPGCSSAASADVHQFRPQRNSSLCM